MPLTLASNAITFTDSTSLSSGIIGTAQLSAGAVTTEKIALSAITPSRLSQPFTFATAKTWNWNGSSSNTFIDFENIPSWAKRITVMFSGVSISSATPYGIIQLGAGSTAITGYVNSIITSYGTPSITVVGNSFTSGFCFMNLGAASETVNGHVIISTLGSNLWVASGVITNSGSIRSLITSGNISLGGALDRIRITTTDGTTTFDAGTINITYEG